eukprot:COSAG06_NODE_39039_length_417_cov_0.644654_1_plen_48_part_10
MMIVSALLTLLVLCLTQLPTVVFAWLHSLLCPRGASIAAEGGNVGQVC